MAKFSAALVLALTAIAVNAVPLERRIDQQISDSTQLWVQACNKAGGGAQCSTVSVTAFSTLLAAAGPCDQQNSADAMIDLAKTLNNDLDTIKFAQIFAQQPRNSPTSEAVPYCQQAPKNAELNGLFQCQFQGVKQDQFVGGIQVGGNGTIPFGLSAPLSPAGSCPANPSGPIPDGQQLDAITQDPGLNNIQSSSGSSGSGSSAVPSDASSLAASVTAASSSAASASTPSISAVSTQASASAVSSAAASSTSVVSQTAVSSASVSASSIASGTGSASGSAAATATSTGSCSASKKKRAATGFNMVKRISQDTTAAPKPWEDACTKAGGAEQCNAIAVTAFGTLLAAADPCAQQNSADAMIDLAKTLNNDPDMIRLAQVFAQQPRNSPTSQAVPYCQTAPKNKELNGLFQCQFASADETTFVGGLKTGSPGTIPFGQTSSVSPAGSCPANPQGPITDGQQLVDITQQPFASGSGASASSAAPPTASSSAGGECDD